MTTIKRKTGPKPTLINPFMLQVQLEQEDVDYLDALPGPRAPHIRAAVSEWIARHKAQTIVAGMRP